MHAIITCLKLNNMLKIFGVAIEIFFDKYWMFYFKCKEDFLTLKVVLKSKLFTFGHISEVNFNSKYLSR